MDDPSASVRSATIAEIASAPAAGDGAQRRFEDADG
jgi:hypothetical protein